MEDAPESPEPAPGAAAAPGADGFDAADPPGWIEPDPDEPPPVELWRAVGGVAPWGTVLLLLSWAIAFGVLLTRNELGDTAAYVRHGASVAAPPTGASVWRLLASTFLHDGYAHLLFNSLSMLVFGPAVERVFTRWAFWTVFAWGGAIASLASLVWRLSRPEGGGHVSLGASGAIFALAGALLVGAWRLRRRLAIGRARALAAAVLFFSMPALAQGFQRVGTDNAAHLGGLGAGLLIGALAPLATRLGGPPPGLAIRVAGTVGALALAAAWLGVLAGLGARG